jgi:hypothetical protein
MNISTTDVVANDIALRNDCIMAMLDDLRGMIFNTARDYGLEFEDAMQEAYCILMETWDRIAKADSMAAYACVVVKEELKHRSYHTWALSLDIPITEDSTETFADMLAVPDTRIQPNEKVAKAVHEALRECEPEVQQFACEEYRLETFKPAIPKRDKPMYYRSIQGYSSKKGYRNAAVRCALKMNGAVQKLVQRERCTL